MINRCTNAHFSNTPLLLYSVCYRAFLIQIKMGLINEETRNEIAETTITVVEREKGEMTEPWKFISLEIDNYTFALQ